MELQEGAEHPEAVRLNISGMYCIVDTRLPYVFACRFTSQEILADDARRTQVNSSFPRSASS